MVLSHGTGVRIPVPVPTFARDRERVVIDDQASSWRPVVGRYCPGYRGGGRRCVRRRHRVRTSRRERQLRPARSRDGSLRSVPPLRSSSSRSTSRRSAALEPVVGRWPWPRLVHASAIDYLKRSGAKVIAYDVLFGEREGARESIVNGQPISGDDSDRRSSSRCGARATSSFSATRRSKGSRAGSVDTARPATDPRCRARPTGRATGSSRDPTLDLPFDELAGAAAGIGHNYLARDPGSDSARRVLPFIEHRGAFVPSLGVAAALMFAGAAGETVRLRRVTTLRIGDARVPTLDEQVGSGAAAEPSRQVLFRFAKPTTGDDGVRSIFPTYSFFDVVLSEDNVLSGRAACRADVGLRRQARVHRNDRRRHLRPVHEPVRRRHRRRRASRHDRGQHPVVGDSCGARRRPSTTRMPLARASRAGLAATLLPVALVRDRRRGRWSAAC